MYWKMANDVLASVCRETSHSNIFYVVFYKICLDIREPDYFQ